MKIVGIVAEYNPFHNGHALHIRETRRRTGCDRVVVCMAGHFTQRGEPAILSKWDRARMALSCGADAVFELPALFAVRTADQFALGGVAILDGLGVDALSFGSEIEDLGLLRMLADMHKNEPESVSFAIQEGLNAGKSHARARGEALGEATGLDPEALNRPNAVLAVEYLSAMDRLDSSMVPVVVPRIGGYHDAGMGEIASATAIRMAFERGDVEAARAAIPEAARPWATPDAMHAMDDMLLYRLRSMDEARLAGLPDMGEGLEHRLYKCCRETAGREALLQALKCKRYTWARLSRMLTHALIGMDRELTREVPMPTYARLIGARADAGELLSALDQRARLPIVSRASALAGDPCFEMECCATDAWSLLHEEPALRVAGREYREKFVTI